MLREPGRLFALKENVAVEPSFTELVLLVKTNEGALVLLKNNALINEGSNWPLSMLLGPVLSLDQLAFMYQIAPLGKTATRTPL